MSRYEAVFRITSRYEGVMDQEYLFIEEDNEITVARLREAVFGGTFLDGATGQFTLFTKSGTTVSGITFPFAMTAVTSAPGRYEGTLKASQLTLTKGDEFDLEVTITSGGRQVARWLRRLVAIDRSG